MVEHSFFYDFIYVSAAIRVARSSIGQPRTSMHLPWPPFRLMTTSRRESNSVLFSKRHGYLAACSATDHLVDFILDTTVDGQHIQILQISMIQRACYQKCC
jgi:hypothetical protein